MAEKPDNSNKIACRSRQAVDFISETLYNGLSASLQNDEKRSPEERSRYIRRFKEVFERVTQQNIVVNGETGEAKPANTTPEYEPVDKQKEVHISEELLPRLDDCVVKVAKKRKRLPHVCHNAVTEFSNHQATYMSKVKPKAQQVDLDSLISDTKDVTRFMDCEQLQQSCADLSRLTKMVLKDPQRAEHLKKAVEIEAANRNCPTAMVLKGHRPLMDDSHGFVCGLCLSKRTLDSSTVSDSPTSSKMARLTAVLARDFTVQSLSS